VTNIGAISYLLTEDRLIWKTYSSFR